MSNRNNVLQTYHMWPYPLPKLLILGSAAKDARPFGARIVESLTPFVPISPMYRLSLRLHKQARAIPLSTYVIPLASLSTTRVIP